MKRLMLIVIIALTVLFSTSANARWIHFDNMQVESMGIIAFHYDNAQVKIDKNASTIEFPVLAVLSPKGAQEVIDTFTKDSTKKIDAKYVIGIHVIDYRANKMRTLDSYATDNYGNKMQDNTDTFPTQWRSCPPDSIPMEWVSKLRKVYNF